MRPGVRPPEPEPPRGRGGFALAVLAVLAVGYTVAIARPFLLPIAFAWLGRLLLAPAVRACKRLHVPPPLGAAAIMLSLTLAVGFGISRLYEPAQDWVDRLPSTVATMQRKLRSSLQDSPLESVTKVSKAVAELTDGRPEQEKPIQVAVVPNETGWWPWVQAFGANLLVMMVLMYLLLATEDAFTVKVLASLPGSGERQQARQLVMAIESSIARYLATITLTNLCLGIVVATISWACGLPNPALWGAIAALANYVPYLGGVVGVGMMAMEGIATFDSIGAGLAPAAGYAAVNSLEGLLITPLILGRRLTLSPVVLFLWLLLLGWLWGIAGALLAVPLLATLKLGADHIPRLQLLARFLGR